MRTVSIDTKVQILVRQAETKIQKVGSRHTIYLRTDIVNDSNFPFQVGESLVVRIEGDRLVVERQSQDSTGSS
jgi:hypothetical protein